MGDSSITTTTTTATIEYASAAARDAAQHTVPPLPTAKVLWAALGAVERAALPLAPDELLHVAAATARSRVSGERDPALTAFLSASVPDIGFARFALHVAKATGYGREGLAVGLALVARYAVASGRGVTPLSMHRLFAASMQLGMKTASDRYLKNVVAAPLVGVPLAELNALERTLAAALDYRTMPTAAELTQLPAALAALRGPAAAPVAMEAVQLVFEAHYQRRDDDDDSVLLPEAAAAVTADALYRDVRAELAADFQHHDDRHHHRRHRPSVHVVVDVVVDDGADDHDDGEFGLLPEAAAVLTAEHLHSDADGWSALCGFDHADSDARGGPSASTTAGTSSCRTRGFGHSAADSSSAAAALC